MTTTLPAIEPRTAPPVRSQIPDASHLENRMPAWFKAPRVLTAFTLFLGVWYLFFSYRPLWHTDVWGHLAYGRWIVESGQVPSTEPLMPLARGVRFVDAAWLSQLIGFAMHQSFGVPGIQLLYAGGITLCLSLLMWRFYRRTHLAGLTMLGLCAFLWVDWQQLAIVRPQIGGLVCFVTLLVMLTSRKWSQANWLLVPLLFITWANLHGSFVVGLVALGAFCVGRACDVLLRTRRPAAVFLDRRVQRYFLLMELAAVAVLLNPYGWVLYREVLTFASSPNLADLLDWEPLNIRMTQGQAAAMIVLPLLILYRMSPRRVSFIEILLLLGFGSAALWACRMIVWWAPVAAYCLVLHGGAVWKQWRRRRLRVAVSPSRPTWAVASLGLIWIFFAYTPFGLTLLHGPQPRFQKMLSAETPVGAVGFLRENPPRGLIFNTYEWGDYLLWTGPKDAQAFVASHAHLVPREVWTDYMDVINGRSEGPEVLDRYGIDTVLLDVSRSAPLIARLRRDEDWQSRYEDNHSIVLSRKHPIGH